MKPLIFFSLLLALTAWAIPLHAQNADDAVTPPPPGDTVITSDELRGDQINHTSIFTGNVLVVGNNFQMRCQEMTVYFTKDNKIDNIIAKGDVVIDQPDRTAHCGQAQYFHDDDKFVLTDQPVIIDNKKNQIAAPKITIYRTNQQMVTEGRTKTVLVNGIGSSTPPSTLPAPQQ